MGPVLFALSIPAVQYIVVSSPYVAAGVKIAGGVVLGFMGQAVFFGRT